MVLTWPSREGLERKRKRQRQRVSRLKLEPRKWAGKRDGVSDREGGGCSSSAGSRSGSPEVSSAHSAFYEGPDTQSCCNTLSQPSWRVASCSPYCLCSIPGTPDTGICRQYNTAWAPSQLKTGFSPPLPHLGPGLASAKIYHFLTLKPGMGLPGAY